MSRLFKNIIYDMEKPHDIRLSDDKKDVNILILHDVKDCMQSCIQKYTRESTIVVCDTTGKAESWQKDGFACVGVELNGPVRNCRYVVLDMDALSYDYLDMVYARFHNIPLVITESRRLIIREMSLEDIPALYDIYKGNVLNYIEPLKDPATERELAESYIKSMYGFYGYGMWLVVRKSDNRIIGKAGFSEREMSDGNVKTEIGYLIGEKYQNQGYAYEACTAILEYAKENLDFEEVISCIEEGNTASVRLAIKLGFDKAGDMCNKKQSAQINCYRLPL